MGNVSLLQAHVLGFLIREHEELRPPTFQACDRNLLYHGNS